MKKTLVLPVLLSGAFANHQFPVEMCPGEKVTINVTLVNIRDLGGADMKDAYLHFWSREGDWLTVEPEGDIWIGTIPDGEQRTTSFTLTSDINEPGGQTAELWYQVRIRNGEVQPSPLGFYITLLDGPGPANLLSATPMSSREINLVWEVTGNEGCCGGYYVAYKPEGQSDFTLNPELIVGATDYTLEVPYPSTKYELRIVTANYDGEPTELVSNSLFAFTHPYLSSRVPYSLDPSNSAKFVEKGDRVYLVHEDQDRVWIRPTIGLARPRVKTGDSAISGQISCPHGHLLAGRSFRNPFRESITTITCYNLTRLYQGFPHFDPDSWLWANELLLVVPPRWVYNLCLMIICGGDKGC